MPIEAPDRQQALHVLELARAVLEQARSRFWRIKDDPAVPYDEVYQLHAAYRKAAREVVELEARIMSAVIAPDAQQLEALRSLRDRLQEQADNRAMAEGVLRLAALLAAI